MKWVKLTPSAPTANSFIPHFVIQLLESTQRSKDWKAGAILLYLTRYYFRYIDAIISADFFFKPALRNSMRKRGKGRWSRLIFPSPRCVLLGFSTWHGDCTNQGLTLAFPGLWNETVNFSGNGECGTSSYACWVTAHSQVRFSSTSSA